MKISEINPHIRYASIHYTYDKAKGFNICYDCRCFFIESASGYIIANGERYDFSNNFILYLPPKTKYRFIFTEDNNFKILVLDFDLVNDFSHISDSLRTATEETFLPDLSPSYELPEELNTPIAKYIPQLKSTISNCCDNFLKKPTFYREQSSAYLKLCLLEILHQISNDDNTHSSLCEQVLSYIHENYATPSLNNQEIADRFNYHPYHLSRIIKQETGITLHQYLTYYRLRIAKNLLITTKHDIEEISRLTGFCTSAYFIKMFRANTGITPKKYRNSKTHLGI